MPKLYQLAHPSSDAIGLLESRTSGFSIYQLCAAALALQSLVARILYREVLLLLCLKADVNGPIMHSTITRISSRSPSRYPGGIPTSHLGVHASRLSTEEMRPMVSYCWAFKSVLTISQISCLPRELRTTKVRRIRCNLLCSPWSVLQHHGLGTIPQTWSVTLILHVRNVLWFN